MIIHQDEQYDVGEKIIGEMFGNYKKSVYICYMEKRMTSNDYRKKMKELQEELASLDSHVTARLLDLVSLYPDAIIIPSQTESSEDIKAKCLTKNYVDNLAMRERIDFIYAIEEWSRSLEKVVQTKIMI